MNIDGLIDLIILTLQIYIRITIDYKILQDNPLCDFPWDRIMSPLLSKKLPDSTLGSVSRLFAWSKTEPLGIAALYVWPVPPTPNDLAHNSEYRNRAITGSSPPQDEWTHAF